MELDDRLFYGICKMLAHYCNSSSVNTTCPISAVDKNILYACPFVHKVSCYKSACERVDVEDWKDFLIRNNESYKRY